MRKPLPEALVTATRCPRLSSRFEAKRAPKPDGVKRSVWSSVWRQRPLTWGEIVGGASPSALSTGTEKVSRIGEAGASCPPGFGWTTATGTGAGGNQLIETGAPSRSHGRAAAATTTLPVAERRGSATELWAPSRLTDLRWPGVP